MVRWRSRTKSVWSGLGPFILLLVAGLPLRAGHTVSLAWDANSEPNLAGYTLYSGTASGLYTLTNRLGRVTLPPASATDPTRMPCGITAMGWEVNQPVRFFALPEKQTSFFDFGG